MTRRRKLKTYRIGGMRITMEPWSWWPKTRKEWSAVWALCVGIGGAVVSIAGIIQADEGLRAVLPAWVLSSVGIVVLIGGIVQRFQTLRAAVPAPPTDTTQPAARLGTDTEIS